MDYCLVLILILLRKVISYKIWGISFYIKQILKVFDIFYLDNKVTNEGILN